MNSRIMFAALFAVTAVTMVSAYFLGWWMLLVGAVLVAATAFLILTRPAARPTETPSELLFPEEPPLPEPVEEPQPRRKHLLRQRVPSAREEYSFLLSAIVCWRGPDPTDSAAEGAAVTAIEERVRSFVRNEMPEENEAVQHRLAAALGAEPCRHPGVWEVWAEEVLLELPEEDAERLRQLREVRKKKAAREEERELERLERAYLGDEALADPGRAVVWWLARNPDRVEEAVGQIGTLTRLSSAATGSEIPQLYRELMRDDTVEEPAFSSGLGHAGLFADSTPNEAEEDGEFDEYVQWERAVRRATEGMNPEGHVKFVDQCAELLKTSGKADIAARLRESFDMADAWTDDDEPPTDEAPDWPMDGDDQRDDSAGSD